MIDNCRKCGGKFKQICMMEHFDIRGFGKLTCPQLYLKCQSCDRIMIPTHLIKLNDYTIKVYKKNRELMSD